MGLFKFCNAEATPKILSGSLRIGSLWLYRLMELATADDWIGDAKEATVVTLLDMPNGPTPNEVKALSDLRLVKGIDERVTGLAISGQFIQQLDGFALSLAKGDFASLQRIMCQSDKRANYDSCVEILDQELLVERIENAFRSEPNLKCKYVVRPGEIHYGIRTLTLGIDNASERNMFAKHIKYKDQCEFRLLVCFELDFSDSFITLQIDPTDLFLERKVDAVIATTPTKRRPIDQDDAKAMIMAAIERRDIPEPRNADLVRCFLALTEGQRDKTFERLLHTSSPREMLALHLIEKFKLYYLIDPKS